MSCEWALRLVSWNCNMGYAGKSSLLERVGCDLAVLPECGRSDAAGLGPSRWAWRGSNSRKGLGVHVLNPAWQIRLREEYVLEDYWWTLPLTVEAPGQDACFNLLAVWAYPPAAQPSGQRFWEIIERLEPFLSERECVVSGDFNSNRARDMRPPFTLHHTRNTQYLERLGMTSAYHSFRQEEPGSETHPTLYWRRDPSRGYHIDYCMLSAGLSQCVRAVEVGAPDPWLAHSDHMPLIVDLGQTPDERLRLRTSADLALASPDQPSLFA